ncbi:MAG: acetate--CoA ligase family protein [Elusimicrobia bacterium]|nr:acetate--CoA ligase family protein [Elusimicrobiota bacterium]
MNEIESLLSHAAQEGRWALSEIEVYDVLDRLGLDTPKRDLVALSRIPLPEAGLKTLLATLPGEKVVLKVSSHKTLHKTEAGGVKVCAKADAAARLSEMKSKFKDADGILVTEFVPHAVFSLGQELMLGARADKAFGPIMTLGIGGTDAEGLTSALKPGFSPAIAAVKLVSDGGGWQRFLDRAWIWRYVSGNVRGGQRLAEDAAMLRWLDGFQRLLAHFSDGCGCAWAIEEVEVNPLAVSDERIVALDGVLRFRKAQSGTRVFPSARAVWSLLKPATVAVAGVSEKKMNMGRIILGNVIEAGFDKKRLFVLKDYAGEIDGAKCFKSPADFPEPVDMFVVAVPSPEVPALLRDSAESGKVRGVALISGGMGEKSGSEGVHNEVLDVIAEGRRKNPDFAVSGGNSLGIVSVPAKVNTFFIPKKKLVLGAEENPAHARTAFVSQSGAFVISVVSKMEWLKPAYCVTVGNQMDVTVCDYVEQLVEDETVKVILVYLEGLKEEDGLKLTHSVARARATGKTVIVYKAGRTPTGTKAVMGHTASIAGDFVVARSVLNAAGALFAENFDHFEELVQMSCFCHGRPAGQGRLFVLSNAGFETAGTADSILPQGPVSAAATDGPLGRRLAEILRKHKLDSIVDVRNPLDVTPMATDAALIEIAAAVLESPQVDGLVAAGIPLTPAMKTLPEEGLAGSFPAKLGELAKASGKPVVCSVACGSLYEPYVAEARKHGLPVFRSADRALRAMAAFCQR